MPKPRKNKNSALAALFRGLGNLATSFEAAAATREEQGPKVGSLSGAKPDAATGPVNQKPKPQGDCGGCK